MITVNFHNKTGLAIDIVWNTMMKAIAGDKTVVDRRVRLHNNRRDQNIVSLTACEPRRGKDVILECDLYDISQLVQVTKSLLDDPNGIPCEDTMEGE